MLSYAAGLVCLICWILVLVQMFRDGVLKGVLGLICGLYAFIWGWMNSGRAGMKNIMLLWTIAMLIGIVGGYYMGFPSILKRP